MSSEKISQPNNKHSETNPVGRFMVAVGAIIVQRDSEKILVSQRASSQDWHPNEWEISYGRIDQHEDPETGLRREMFEELGLTDLSVKNILRVWHIYRGPVLAENDLIGITFVCSTASKEIRLSNEHQAYKWVKPEEALDLIKIEGIRKDVEAYIKLRS
jgi:8-oxo-dGTP pyrophosphatase MutT (NUDIX family)